MNETRTTPTPTRTMYSLEEAAALSGCTVETLLRHGAERHLSILARVPDDVRVYCTNLDLVELSDSALDELSRRMRVSYLDGVRPLARSDIHLLVLTPADCGLIAAHGEAYQSVFLTGVAFNGAFDPVFVEPPALAAKDGYHDMRPFRRFACYAVGHDPSVQGAPSRIAPIRIKLAPVALRVRRNDLISLNLIRVADVSMVKFDNGFRQMPHMSRRLICLNNGALHFWDRGRPGWCPPLANDVERWFRDECNFPVKVAEGATQILYQSYKDWDPVEYGKQKAKDDLNMFDAVVLIAAGWKNADLGIGEREDQIDTYPEKNDAIKLLKTKYGFALHSALAAWNIARPQEAKPIGREKDYDDGA